MEEFLEKLYYIDDEIEKLMSDINNRHAEIMKDAKNRTIVVPREDSEEEIKESVAWEEYITYGNQETGKALQERYAELFDLQNKLQEKQTESQKLLKDQFGFNPDQLNTRNLIKLIRPIVQHEIKKYHE